MRTEREFAAVMVCIVTLVAWGDSAQAGVVNVPNASFESPYVAMVSPYASSEISDWQKAPAPDWWLGQGYTTRQWTESAGVFVNVPFLPIDNADGRQVAFVFATPGVELFQDLNVQFEPGRSYQLTVGAVGGGYGMKLDVPLEFRLYYRDDTILSGDNRVTVGAAVARNTNATGQLTHLTDYPLDVPAVAAGDAWAGRNIGVQLISTVSFADVGGYWDIDNVRLTSVPEPTSLAMLVWGAFGLGLRRRT